MYTDNKSRHRKKKNPTLQSNFIQIKIFLYIILSLVHFYKDHVFNGSILYVQI